MYQSIYRKYRPQTFNDIYGQDAISQTLTNAIIYDRVAHAYLFSGPRGTGKTSTAKLLAKALNCTNIVDGKICDACENCLMIKNNSHPDVLEIDAASNNGVDEVRDLIEKVKYAPIKGRKKVYIIDEIHMMSQGAFNALLKTLEEPPEHVVFILATTESHKVLATIKSRCQKFNFKKISEKDIVACLTNIVEQEDCTYEPEALTLIASLCDGGMRDALSLLEQVMIYGNNDISVKNVTDALDLVNETKLQQLYQLLLNKEMKKTLAYVDELAHESIDYKQVLNDIVKRGINDLTKIKSEDHDDFRITYLLNMIEVFDESLTKLKFDNSKRLYLDLAIIKTINFDNKSVITNEVIATEKNETVPQVPNFSPEPLVEEYRTTVTDLPTTSDLVEDKVDEINIDSNQQELVLESLTNNFEEVEHQEETIEEDEVLAQVDVVDEGELMNILVQATRDDLDQVKEKWAALDSYLLNVNTKKEASLLIEAKPVAASANGIIVVCQQDFEVSLINSMSNLERIVNFMGELIQEKKYCFAINQEAWLTLKNKYLQLRQVNKLPKPRLTLENIALKTMEPVEEKEEIEDDLLVFGKKIFKDKITVKRDE